MTKMSSHRLKVLYLASNPYSGSTVVTMRLAMDKAFATVGEISGPDPRVKKSEHKCSCGELTVKCEFWGVVEKLSVEHGFATHILDFDKRYRLLSNRILHKLLTTPSQFSFVTKTQMMLVQSVLNYSRKDKEIWCKNYALARAVLDHFQAEIFLDSSKDIERIYRYAGSENVDLFVLHIVRDGRAQLASSLSRGGNAERLSANIARFDAGVERLALHLGAERYLRTKYEDFCVRPSNSIEEIKRFCGADMTVSEGRSIEDLHVLGNPSRFRFDGTLKASESGWRSNLSPDLLTVFERRCGKRNRTYGYD